MTPSLKLRFFDQPMPYDQVLKAMQQWTIARTEDTEDECWLMTHAPTYTLGQASDPAHLIDTLHHPVVQSDRGGQVTFHGPGQLMGYCLIDLRRQDYKVHGLVDRLENTVISYLATLGIKAIANPNARGVYVDGQKIASIGLRVKKGSSYHGFSLNVAMDLSPFAAINPCGHTDLAMTQVSDHHPCTIQTCIDELTPILCKTLGPYAQITAIHQSDLPNHTIDK